MGADIFISVSYAETEALGKKLGESLSGTETVALFGGMGMGKTAFVRGLAAGLGIDPDSVSSPTFAIVHEHSGDKKLFHFDMYRVESFDDLYQTGFFEYEGAGVTAVEWSENIENVLPKKRVNVRILPGDNADERKITIERINL